MIKSLWTRPTGKQETGRQSSVFSVSSSGDHVLEVTSTSWRDMFTSRKTSLPSPTLEDSFFPLSSSSSLSLSFALPPSAPHPGNSDGGGVTETDLILAAELGRALLEKNEELAASVEESQRQVEVRGKSIKV